MILPIIAYGDPILRKVGTPLSQDDSNLHTLIADMFETMYHAKGVGLAAPQVGKSVRLFIVDASPFDDDEEDMPEHKNFKKVFINAEILEETGKEWPFSEGCLSIPEIRENVDRKPDITIRYYDENFVLHEEKYSGIIARIIQHEYDHIEGKLFIDKISPIKKRLISKKLEAITRGMVKPDYKMKYPAISKKIKILFIPLRVARFLN
jgi:peptide deformylase